MTHDGATAILALGGNVGDVAGAFAQALTAISAQERVRLLARSHIYRTPPWGVTDQPDFLNMVALVVTDLTPRELLALCLSVERTGGRVRDLRWGPRRIDIDIIAYGDVEMTDEDLTLPHPRAHERAFVLVPLAEIAPETRLGGRQVRELVAEVDAGGVLRDDVADATLAAAGF